MSIHFHPLSIKEIRKETPECVSVVFEIPDQLKKTFLYSHGQNVTIKYFIDGEELRRSYSICSGPFEEELRIAIKHASPGKFSSYANTILKEGDILQVLPPTGKFYTELNVNQRKNYLAFAAGSGITPILSIIKTTFFTEADSSFTLVYGNRNRQNIIFREVLEGLKNKFPERLQLIHILSREKTDAEINSGRINEEKCRLIFDKLINIRKVDEFFLCGPEEMIFSVKKFLEEKTVDRRKIHFELFTTPGFQKKENDNIKDPELKRANAKVYVKLDGLVTEFELGFGDESILTAALKQGIDLPFSCKGGVCSTCRAKLEEGEVEMDRNYALEPEEVEKGFILTCQSHPRTVKVVVNFDEK